MAFFKIMQIRIYLMDSTKRRKKKVSSSTKKQLVKRKKVSEVEGGIYKPNLT
jgi:hypothetical protein